MAEADLSKIVSLIMENPKLIEQIKNLASQNSEGEEPEIKADSAEAEVIESADTESAEVSTYAPVKNDNRSRRNTLLSALKPYVSEKRCQAIDSMISIADIIDVVRSR